MVSFASYLIKNEKDAKKLCFLLFFLFLCLIKLIIVIIYGKR